MRVVLLSLQPLVACLYLSFHALRARMSGQPPLDAQPMAQPDARLGPHGARGPKRPPRCLHDGSRGRQYVLQTGPRRPNSVVFFSCLSGFCNLFLFGFPTVQEAPNIAPRASRRPPIWTHDGPRGHKKSSNIAQEGCTRRQEGTPENHDTQCASQKLLL